MKKLIIDRSKWARGGMNGDAMLLNKDGNMCCLGFACLASGLSPHNIDGHEMPEDLSGFVDPLSAFLYYEDEEGRWVDNSHVNKAAGINDSEQLTDEEREAKLKPVLAAMGFDVEFV